MKKNKPHMTQKTDRKSIQLFILFGCIITLLFLVITFFSIRWSVTSTEAYRDAMRRVRTSPEILEKLGAPVSPGWWISSSRHNEAAAGILEFSLSVSGPRGRGTVACRARLTYREWSFDLLEVKIDGKQEVINLRSGR